MAKDDDPWRRFHESDKEDTTSTQIPAKGKGKLGVAVPGKPGADAPAASLEKLIQQIEPLIEQVNNLYNQYFAGVDRRPPIEGRNRLEALMTQLTQAHKATPASAFRYNSIHSRFVTHRERWDRVLKQMESAGKKR